MQIEPADEAKVEEASKRLPPDHVLFTPHTSEGERLYLAAPKSFKMKIGESGLWGQVRDAWTGNTYAVYGAGCGSGCHCDALAVPCDDGNVTKLVPNADSPVAQDIESDQTDKQFHETVRRMIDNLVKVPPSEIEAIAIVMVGKSRRYSHSIIEGSEGVALLGALELARNHLVHEVWSARMPASADEADDD